MASIAFPSLAKSHTLSTFHTYGYAYQFPSKTSLPTILFLHGFPSSCYDWRHQIHFFSSQGYGVLAPDLLGYGDTAKPAALEEYKSKKMASEIIELLDHEGIDKVHAVGHDTGCTLLSRLADYFPARLLSATFLDVPYSKPGEHFDLAVVNALTKQFLGYERFGYLEFFAREGAGDILDQHSDSFFTLFYPRDPSLWVENVGLTGAMEIWLLRNGKGPEPEYVEETERQIHQAIMQNSHGSALKWYQALVRNISVQEEIEAKIKPVLSMPVLMICPQPTQLELPGVEKQMKQVARDLSFKRVSTSGHWVQLEAMDEVNAILKEFFER
ncbi:alpha/beta fold hydrolase [Aspergillus undulatus]|uniref:alpha/beta fold hydrolase n=1 Tax=Aspergillus undulatus TaxID=1810928 RepID=UPI003CCDA4A9